MITNFYVSCVTCGYDNVPDTYVVRVTDDTGLARHTVTYCYVCAKIAELIETTDKLREARDGVVSTDV